MKRCQCGHSEACHLHNFTGELFGSVVAHCAFCPCRQFQENQPATAPEGEPAGGTLPAPPREPKP